MVFDCVLYFYPLAYPFACCIRLLSYYPPSKSFAWMFCVGEDLTAWCNSNCSLFYGSSGSMGWVSVLASRIYFTDIIKPATLSFPEVLPFPRIAKGLLSQFQYHRSHISHMRVDCLSRLVKKQQIFTIFVVLPSGPTIPLCKNFI